MFATPIGVGLFGYLRLHLTLPALHPVDEFRAPSWLSDPALFVYGAGLVAVGGRRLAAAVRPGRRCFPRWCSRRSPSRSVRFAADVALVTAPLLAVQPHGGRRSAARALAAAAPRADPVGGRGRADRGARRRPARWRGRAAAGSISIRASCRWPRSRSSTRTACAIGCTTTSRPARICCSIPPAGYPRHRVFVDPRLPAYPAEFHRLLGRADLTRAEWNAAMDRYGVETRAAVVRGRQPAGRLVGSGTLGARVPRGGRARVRPASAAVRAADRQPRDPGDVRLLAAGGKRHAAARGAAGLVTRSRLRMAAPARRSDLRARRRDGARPARSRRTTARWRRPPAAWRPPTRRGSPPGAARSRSAPGGRPMRWRCSIARSPAATASWRRSPTAPWRSKGSAARATPWRRGTP